MAENYFNLHLRNKSGSQESSRASNVASFKPEYNKSVLKEGFQKMKAGFVNDE